MNYDRGTINHTPERRKVGGEEMECFIPHFMLTRTHTRGPKFRFKSANYYGGSVANRVSERIIEEREKILEG